MRHHFATFVALTSLDISLPPALALLQTQMCLQQLAHSLCLCLHLSGARALKAPYSAMENKKSNVYDVKKIQSDQERCEKNQKTMEKQLTKNMLHAQNLQRLKIKTESLFRSSTLCYDAPNVKGACCCCWRWVSPLEAEPGLVREPLNILMFEAFSSFLSSTGWFVSNFRQFVSQFLQTSCIFVATIHAGQTELSCFFRGARSSRRAANSAVKAYEQSESAERR